MPNFVVDGQLKRSLTARRGNGLEIGVYVCAFITNFHVQNYRLESVKCVSFRPSARTDALAVIDVHMI